MILFEIEETTAFRDWIDGLKDDRARRHIRRRLLRLKDGNFGDHRGLGAGLLELRMHFGPGYRVYYTVHGGRLVILLGGGTKRRQDTDIEQARKLLETLR